MDFLGIGPEFFEGIKFAEFVVHDMDHDVDEIEDDPAGFGIAFGVGGFDAVGVDDLIGDVAEDGAQLGHGGAGADDHEVGDGRESPDIPDTDILGFGFIGGACAGFGEFLSFDHRKLLRGPQDKAGGGKHQ